MSYTLAKEENDNHTLSRMFVDMMHKHTGLDYDIEQFISRTVVLRVQPITGQHVYDLPVQLAVDYLTEQHTLGKTQVLFFGVDEMMQDFSLEKVQAIAEEVQHLFTYMVYAIDELDIELYPSWCKQHNKQPVLTICGGIHFAFHSPDEYPQEGFNDQPNKPYHFVFYSRMPRTVRLQMLGTLIRDNLLHKGLISAFPSQQVFNSLADEETLTQMPELGYLVDNQQLFPISLDETDPWTSDTNLCTVTSSNVHHRNNSYFSLVSETAFYNQPLNGSDVSHLGGKTFTEKTFRPMIVKHPFVLIARENSLRTLREYGFKTFDTWWDESYDAIENDRERFLKISNLVYELCCIEPSHWDCMLEEMQPVLEHNYQLMRQRPFDFTATSEMSTINKFLKV